MKKQLGCLVALAALGLAAPVSAQTSPLYVNTFDTNQMFVVQGGSVINSWTTPSVGQNAIAVSGDIRLGGSGIGSYTGNQYTLGGTLLGGTYTMPAAGNWYDGTTDGANFNFAVQHNGDYFVHRFDRNWQNSTPLFSVGFANSGISYDTTNSSLWVAEVGSGVVSNYTQAGILLSSFNFTPNTFSFGYGMALDPADNTLWLGAFGSNELRNYDKSGNFLGSVFVQDLPHGFGMEFNIGGAAVPEPTTWALMALTGIAASGTYSWRRWKASRRK